MIFHRMPYSGIYRRRRRYRILPEAKYIDPFYPRCGTHPTGWNPPVEWTWFVPTGKPCFPFIEPCQFGVGGGTAHRPFPTDSSNIIPFNQPLNYHFMICIWKPIGLLCKYFKFRQSDWIFLVQLYRKEHENFPQKKSGAQKNKPFPAGYSRLIRTGKNVLDGKSENFNTNIIKYSPYDCQFTVWKKICISFCSVWQNLYLFTITVLRLPPHNPLTGAPFCAFIFAEAHTLWANQS